MDTDERRRKHAEYMREWRAKHPENKEYQRAYQEKYLASDVRREEARLRARTWYEQNRERVIAAARRRYDALPKKGYSTGAGHHRWRGDDVGYFALHAWVEREKGTPRLCEHCGSTDAKRYEWANVDHCYRRVLDQWIRLCTSCHRRHDYANGLSNKGGRKRKPPD